MKAGYEDFEQSVFEMEYDSIITTTKAANSKFDEIRDAVAKIKTQLDSISGKIEGFRPQNDEQRKRLEEVHQQLFHVEQVVKKTDITLAKEEKERAELAENFKQCTKIVDDIKEYSPW